MVEPRTAPSALYGIGCGLADSAFPGTGEGVRPGPSVDCLVCQVAREPGGCLRQACSMRCVFDEDCPEGSLCLCDDEYPISYCAAATDRSTDLGRAAGLPACPP